VTEPPLRTLLTASCTVGVMPTTSNARSAPRPFVSSRIAAGTSPSSDLSASVAPSCKARFSRSRVEVHRNYAAASRDPQGLHDHQPDHTGADHNRGIAHDQRCSAHGVQRNG
jgi:hypothetical protein